MRALASATRATWSCSSKGNRVRGAVAMSPCTPPALPPGSAHPAGLGRTASLRGRARARSGASSDVAAARLEIRSERHCPFGQRVCAMSLSEFALPTQVGDHGPGKTVIVPRGVKPGGRFAVPLPALAQPTSNRSFEQSLSASSATFRSRCRSRASAMRQRSSASLSKMSTARWIVTKAS